ncbi:MAG: hypothetical protein HQL22_01285 [Candidatus Omnitrophica bacterium]|nr:hypothetical protein [Candidatus Omnitrophota bacterium]
MSINGYIDYQRREYCKAVACPLQVDLDCQLAGSPAAEKIRYECQTACRHTTYEFHHWLINKGYLVVRPE